MSLDERGPGINLQTDGKLRVHRNVAVDAISAKRVHQHFLGVRSEQGDIERGLVSGLKLEGT